MAFNRNISLIMDILIGDIFKKYIYKVDTLFWITEKNYGH